MTYLAITLCVLLAAQTAGVLWYLRSRDERDSVERREFTRAFHDLLEATRSERQLLLNRIQAPEIATAQAIELPTPSKQSVSPFDDDAHWDEVERLEEQAID